jgi:hypothetical protein
LKSKGKNDRIPECFRIVFVFTERLIPLHQQKSNPSMDIIYLSMYTHTHTHTHTHIFTNLQCAMYYTWLSKYKEHDRVGHRVAQTVILATQEVEIRRIEVRSQPGQIVCKNLSQKTLHKNRAGGVAQWLKVKALSSSPSTTHTHTHSHKI